MDSKHIFKVAAWFQWYWHCFLHCTHCFNIDNLHWITYELLSGIKIFALWLSRVDYKLWYKPFLKFIWHKNSSKVLHFYFFLTRNSIARIGNLFLLFSSTQHSRINIIMSFPWFGLKLLLLKRPLLLLQKKMMKYKQDKVQN